MGSCSTVRSLCPHGQKMFSDLYCAVLSLWNIVAHMAAQWDICCIKSVMGTLFRTHLWEPLGEVLHSMPIPLCYLMWFSIVQGPWDDNFHEQKALQVPWTPLSIPHLTLCFAQNLCSHGSVYAEIRQIWGVSLCAICLHFLLFFVSLL